MQTRLLSLEVFLALLGVAATLSTLSALSTPVAAIPTTATLHTAVPTECGSYFVWQSIGLVYSHRKIKQPGQLTRIVSCTPEEWEAMSTESREFVQTHVAPNYAVHPRTGDKYPAYNKPMAVIDWLAKTDVKEDYVLIIDADMIMRRPIVPDPSSPLATSAFFGYMIGVNNELAVKVRLSMSERSAKSLHHLSIISPSSPSSLHHLSIISPSSLHHLSIISPSSLHHLASPPSRHARHCSIFPRWRRGTTSSRDPRAGEATWRGGSR